MGEDGVYDPRSGVEDESGDEGEEEDLAELSVEAEVFGKGERGRGLDGQYEGDKVDQDIDAL